MPVDELHFIVSVLACPQCSQQFVSTLTESVDWSGGDDAQFWTLLPVTEAEARDLIDRGASLTEAEVAALGPGRRMLRRDHPTGGSPRAYWSPGA